MARGCRIWQGVKNMASELAIYYTPMHFMWGVKSGATPVLNPAVYLAEIFTVNTGSSSVSGSTLSS